VTEPFVTLLVEASWPRGRLLREYTVLLDPPVFAPGPATAEAPVATPRSSASAPAPSSTTYEAPAAPTPRPSRSEVAAPTIEPGSDYRVRHNDTLWKIASAAHPGGRRDVNRAMLAIYQTNPHAFEGNINVLRAGSTLHIPQESEVAAISASAAADEVARQYPPVAARRRGRHGTPGHLRLVTPDQGYGLGVRRHRRRRPAAMRASSSLAFSSSNRSSPRLGACSRSRTPSLRRCRHSRLRRARLLRRRRPKHP
jgi:FimV-like protein